MDKKNTFIGLGLLALAFLASFWQSRQEAQELSVLKDTHEDVRELEQALDTQLAADAKTVQAPKASLFKTIESQALITQDAKPTAETYALENDKVTVTFTTQGAAIAFVALKDYPAIQGEEAPIEFNTEGQEAVLELCLKAGNSLKPMGGTYSLVSHNPATGHILFRHTTDEGVEMLRGYSVAQTGEARDPYVILHETKIINHSEQGLSLSTFVLNLGTIPPVAGDQTGEFLNFGYYNGADAEFVSIHDFQDSSGFLGIGKRKALPYVTQEGLKLQWGAVKNQFFTCVVTPETPASGYFVTPVNLPSSSKAHPSELALSAALAFDFNTLPAGESRTLSAQCYVGPKEYNRLEQLGDHQDLVMQFGTFGFISKLLLVLLTSIHNLIPNYGVTIILVTCLIKLLLWPLTAASVRSSRRMAALQGPMKTLKEKFKDNPQRIQQETMKLFKEHRVNPAAGCLPIVVQIPIFLGLFWMLRSASELRFASFLWIPDLSLPDTMGVFYGVPLNILPLFMGITMFLQMKFSPTPSADPLQQKLFQLMPFLFLVICYNFPAGLVLYWTVQNLLTILQQALMRGEKSPAVTIHPPAKKIKKARKFGTA